MRAFRVLAPLVLLGLCAVPARGQRAAVAVGVSVVEPVQSLPAGLRWREDAAGRPQPVLPAAGRGTAQGVEVRLPEGERCAAVVGWSGGSGGSAPSAPRAAWVRCETQPGEPVRMVVFVTA